MPAVRANPSPFGKVGDPCRVSVLELLRCPTCSAVLTIEIDQVVCPTGHRFGLIGGRAPDLVGHLSQADSIGQFFMRFRPLVTVYERVWRPLFTASAGGTDPDAETALLAGWLDPGPDAVVVDVACGPGNTTRRLAAGLAGARLLGVDLSVPMLEQALADTPLTSGIGFARVDAHRLPLEDASVDGVHCAAALYLISNPAAVVAEVGRVLRPGRRFVGMTLVAPFKPIGPLGRATRALSSAASGLHYVSPNQLAAMCQQAGLSDFYCQRHGAALLFRASS